MIFIALVMTSEGFPIDDTFIAFLARIILLKLVMTFFFARPFFDLAS